MQSSWPAAQGIERLIAGRYRLLHSLGEGAFGEVFLAEDTKFEPPRPVALKLLHRALISDPAVRDSIRHEASVLARFSHPHILRVLDFEVRRDLAFIVTEYAPNGSLARLLRPDPVKAARVLPLAQAGQYLEQVAAALDEAHGQGLIHRDIKPENILLDKANRTLLADFGLALNSQNTMNWVGSAGVWGTAEYAAPEVWDEKVSKSTDIYALGILLYQMVAGQTPFQGTPAALMRHHIETPVPRLSQRAPWLKYPPALDEVLAKALAKNPAERYKSARHLHQHYQYALTNPARSLFVAPTPRPSGNQPANRPLVAGNPNITASGLKHWLTSEETMEERYRLFKLVTTLLSLLVSYRGRKTASPASYNRRGQSYANLELFGLAIRNFDRAIELNPDYAPAYRNRGLAKRERGDEKGAWRDLQQAARLGDQRAREELMLWQKTP